MVFDYFAAQNFSLKLNDLSLVKEHLEKKAENQKVILFELKRDSTKIIAELTEKVNVLDKRIKQLKWIKNFRVLSVIYTLLTDELKIILIFFFENSLNL